MDNWLLIVVAGIFLICIAVGYIRGFLKFGLSLLATLITMILVTFLSPYVSNALVKYTPIDDVIEKKMYKNVHAGDFCGRFVKNKFKWYTA